MDAIMSLELVENEIKEMYGGGGASGDVCKARLTGGIMGRYLGCKTICITCQVNWSTRE
jgi:hypothetical protein